MLEVGSMMVLRFTIIEISYLVVGLFHDLVQATH